MASKIVLHGMGAFGGISAWGRSDNHNLFLIALGFLMAIYIHYCFHPWPIASYLPMWPYVIGRLSIDCLVIWYGFVMVD